MSTTEDPVLEPETDAPTIAVDSPSVLEKIKKRRDEREDTLTIEIPSWDGDLMAVYKVVERDDIEKMIRRARRAAQDGNRADAAMEADADFLIKACVGVKAVDPDSDIEQQIATGYTMDLARMLDPKNEAGDPIQIRNERELVAYLVKWNGIALAAHGQKVARWMQDTSKPVEDPT